MNLLIFGPQGSGKGTQANLLVKKYGLAHIETGLIFRDISKEDSSLGREVFDIVNVRKELIPDTMTADVIRYYLEKVPVAEGVILDSAPRTLGQIRPVEEMLAKLGRSVDKAIYIVLPYDESVARITKRFSCAVCGRSLILGKDIAHRDDICPRCGGQVTQRADDTPEGVAKRLKTFYEVTIPAIEHYRVEGKLIEVDGSQTVEKVFEDIIKALDN